MLKGLSAPLRLRSSARCRRVVRARGARATALDPRLRRVFDNVDETTTRKEKSTVKRETATPPEIKSEAEDWVTNRAKERPEWGSTEKSEAPSEDKEDGEYFRDEGTSYYKASSISVLNEADKV